MKIIEKNIKDLNFNLEELQKKKADRIIDIKILNESKIDDINKEINNNNLVLEKQIKNYRKKSDNINF